MLGFFIYLSRATGGSRSSITDTCLGVKAAIKALGLYLVGQRGYLIAGIS